MSFGNVYDDAERAEAYATLEFPGTYWLAFRDLPVLIAEHVAGRKALDFGCGAGRSTRFLKGLRFAATGVDVSESMIDRARSTDPQGEYRLIGDGDFSALGPVRFDLILCAFPFDNIPGAARRRDLLRGMRGLLNSEGRIVLVGSAAEIYTHEWASFSTKDFPENADAKSGDTVRIVMTDVDDRRPVIDAIWFHEDYLKLFAEADLNLVAHHSPLGRKDEPYAWVTETSISPWFIYVLKRKG
jgi:SAM-dependent methyltransferase